MSDRSVSDQFRSFSERVAHAVGSPAAFFAALVVVAAWGICGPIFSYSDTWQLIINTGTTIVTFLIVFLIQNTQNRDTQILNLKLDELIRALDGARNSFVNLDQFSEAQLKEIRLRFSEFTDDFAPLLNDDIAEIDRELRSRSIRQKDVGQTSTATTAN